MVKTRVIRLHAFRSFLVEGHDQFMNKELFVQVYYDVSLGILQNYETPRLLSSFLCTWFAFRKPWTSQEASENCNHADLAFFDVTRPFHYNALSLDKELQRFVRVCFVCWYVSYVCCHLWCPSLKSVLHTELNFSMLFSGDTKTRKSRTA